MSDERQQLLASMEKWPKASIIAAYAEAMESVDALTRALAPSRPPRPAGMTDDEATRLCVNLRRRAREDGWGGRDHLLEQAADFIESALAAPRDAGPTIPEIASLHAPNMLVYDNTGTLLGEWRGVGEWHSAAGITVEATSGTTTTRTDATAPVTLTSSPPASAPPAATLCVKCRFPIPSHETMRLDTDGTYSHRECFVGWRCEVCGENTNREGARRCEAHTILAAPEGRRDG